MKIYVYGSDQADEIRYIHYDNRSLEIGDSISGNHNTLNPDVIKAYESLTTGISIEDILYMTGENSNDDEWYDAFKYKYVVRPNGVVYQGYCNYSPLIAHVELYNPKGIFYEFDETLKYRLCETFAKAYFGDEESKVILSYLGYTPFNTIEYITNSATILDKKNVN